MKTYKHSTTRQVNLEKDKHLSSQESHAKVQPQLNLLSQGAENVMGNITMLHQSIGNQAVQRALERLNSETPIGIYDVYRQTKKRTKEEAIALVPAHVEPKECFIWKINTREGWGPIPGTGCAHWVSHQLGIQNGHPCQEGFSWKVEDVLAGRENHPLKEAQVGDIWKQVNARHVGIVRDVKTDPKTNQVIEVQVEHDSSRQGGVVTDWFKSGNFYR